VKQLPRVVRWLIGGLGAVALLTGLLVVKGEGQRAQLPPDVTTSASPTATAVPGKRLANLLLTVTDRKGRTLAATIVNRSLDSSSIDIVSVDTDVVVDLDTLGMTNLGSTSLETSPDLVQDAVSVATGFPIEGTLVLQRLSLAGLIDSVGGIDVTSAGDFVVSPIDEQPVYVFAGMQHLDGTQASYYATFLQEGEPESSRVARLNTVLSATLSSLPKDSKRLKEIITALGALAKSTVPTQDIAGLFLDLNAGQAWKSISKVAIPTVASDLSVEPESGWLRVSRGASLKLARKITGQTVSSVPDAPVVVMVGSAVPADRLQARSELVGASLAFVDGGARKARAHSTLSVDPRLTQVQIAQIAKALKLPATVVESLKVKANLPADALVTLGTDVLVPNP
jgi:anionic cell wall polymer biosynthesis LytR-Cps2A-Psr (LCP) family protein